MNKKTIWAVIGIIIVLLFLVVSKSGYKSKDLVIGAILPMTGPASLWGESVKNGMELALLDHPNIKVIYEDSKGTAQDGLSAYDSLLNKDVDMFIASISAVTIPLSTRSLETKIPMLVTQSAANNLTNEYTYRYYSNADAFASPAFTDETSPLKSAKKIAVLYRGDEYATSVANKIKQLSAQEGKEVVFFESYLPNEIDFSSVMTKVKASKADAFLYVPTPPGESIAILKKAEELGLNIPVMEISNVMSDETTRAKAPKIQFYTNQFAFSISGNSEDFKSRYFAKYKIAPNFVAGFGYDMINLVAECPKDAIKKCLDNVKAVDGVTGKNNNVINHDIILPMYLMKVN